LWKKEEEEIPIKMPKQPTILDVDVT